MTSTGVPARRSPAPWPKARRCSRRSTATATGASHRRSGNSGSTLSAAARVTSARTISSRSFSSRNADRHRLTGPQRSKLQLICAYLAGDVGPLSDGPSLDELAPDFALTTPDGKGKISISQHRTKKPLVLVLRSFTCNQFRAQSGDVENDVPAACKDRADFLAIYVREAHPTDGWALPFNEKVGISIAQPKAFEERRAAASTCCRSLKTTIPMVVDEIDDRRHAAWRDTGPALHPRHERPGGLQGRTPSRSVTSRWRWNGLALIVLLLTAGIRGAAERRRLPAWKRTADLGRFPSWRREAPYPPVSA